MENNNNLNLENKKEIDNLSSQKKKLSFLLFPKTDYQINKDKFIFPHEDFNMNNINEKKFYKTAGKGFTFGRINKKSFTNFQNPKLNSFNHKRIRSSTIDKANYYNTNRIQKENFYSNKDNDNNILILQKRINEIEKELENNENTFAYNQKMMQKKIDEKEETITQLTKKYQI